MADFVEDLKNRIISTMPDVSPDWAELCAIAPLSAILHNARIIEQEKYLKLNLLMLMVGQSGIKKSMPMTTWTYQVVKETGEKLGRDFILPSRSSVEGFINYMSTLKPKDKPRDAGIMIRDEFGGLFNQLRKADWQADGMEFISEMYDGIYQKRATVTHGVSHVESLYASLMSATTPQFITMMDSDFFIQGTGNRILYCYYDVNDYKSANINTEEYFKKQWSGKKEKEVSEFAEALVRIYKKDIRDIYVMPEAGLLWADFKLDCEKEWKQKSIMDPLGWDYHPIKRYPEFVLKLSGLYAVSSQISRIPKIPSSHWDNSVIVYEKDMERAIERVKICKEHFHNIIKLKHRNIPGVTPVSLTREARAILHVFGINQYLDSKTWWDRQEITSSPNKFNKLKKICINKGWVDEFKRSEVKKDVRIQLKNDNLNARFYKISKEMQQEI